MERFSGTVVLIAEQHRTSDYNRFMLIMNWMWDNMDIPPEQEIGRRYEILYVQYTPADGQWRSHPESEPWAVLFENEDDAIRFKLAWG